MDGGGWNLWRRMKEAGVKIGFVDEVVGNHHQEMSQLVFKMKIMAFSDFYANLKSTKDLEPLREEVDLSIFCWDLLGYGTDINQCLESTSKPFVR